MLDYDGTVDVTDEGAIDDNGGTAWRFPTIELELGALAIVRAQVQASEREVGPVEFSSLPAEDDEIAVLTRGRDAASDS